MNTTVSGKGRAPMKSRWFGQAGFTLMEIIVVLAVIGALTAVLVPVVFRYIDDARKSQAQSDVNTIAAAINQMYKDTGRWPFYNSGTSSGTLKKSSGVDAEFLTSNTAIPGFEALSTDTLAPLAASGSITGWTTTGMVDKLDAQLIKNTPVYPTTGARPWKGPYLDKIPTVDPWGKSYLVNIGNADPNTEPPAAGPQKWTIAISGGPNGVLDTSADKNATASPSALGDDLVARVK